MAQLFLYILNVRFYSTNETTTDLWLVIRANWNQGLTANFHTIGTVRWLFNIGDGIKYIKQTISENQGFLGTNCHLAPKRLDISELYLDCLWLYYYMNFGGGGSQLQPNLWIKKRERNLFGVSVPLNKLVCGHSSRSLYPSFLCLPWAFRNVQLHPQAKWFDLQ